MSILEIKSLVKHFGEEPNVTKAVDDISLCIEKCQFAAITGRSGSGKTTLLHLIGGLERPDSGSIIIDGQVIFSCDLQNASNDKRTKELISNEALTVFRRKNIGFIFQGYNLLPILNLQDNILLPLGLDGKSADESFFREVVNSLGLSYKLRESVRHLSGGEQQRVAIARAIITKPALILADEPTGNLDTRTGEEVLSLLLSAAKRFSQTIIMVTHDDAIAKRADVRVYMEDGKIKC